MAKTRDRVPEDWLRTTLRNEDAVRVAFVTESAALYTSGDIPHATFLNSMRLVLECVDAGPTDQEEDDA